MKLQRWLGLRWKGNGMFVSLLMVVLLVPYCPSEWPQKFGLFSSPIGFESNLKAGEMAPRVGVHAWQMKA